MYFVCRVSSVGCYMCGWWWEIRALKNQFKNLGIRKVGEGSIGERAVTCSRGMVIV